MATLLREGDRYTLQFCLRPHDRRRTVALGAMDESDAKATRRRVEALIDALRADSTPDKSTAAWVARLPDALHVRLAATGLIVPCVNPDAPPAVPLLGSFLAEYITKKIPVVKPNTVVGYRQTERALSSISGQAARCLLSLLAMPKIGATG